MLLYPKEKKGSVVMEAVPKLITADVMTVDDLYSAIGRRAKELRFTEETREIDGHKYLLIPADGGVELNGIPVFA